MSVANLDKIISVGNKTVRVAILSIMMQRNACTYCLYIPTVMCVLGKGADGQTHIKLDVFCTKLYTHDVCSTSKCSVLEIILQYV